MSIPSRPNPFRQKTIGTGQGQLSIHEEDNGGAPFQQSVIPSVGLNRQDSLGASLGRPDDMQQQLSPAEEEEIRQRYAEVQQYLADERARRAEKEKQKKKGKTKSKKVKGGRKRRRRTRRKTRRKSGGEPHGEFEKGGEVRLTEAGLNYYTANVSPEDARWLFGGRPQPDRETAAAWRGKINDSQASGWDSDEEGSTGYVQVQWPRNTISYPSGVGRMIGYGVDRPLDAQPHLHPPINYIELVRRKKPPKSAMKKHTTKKKKQLTLLGGKRRRRKTRRKRRRRRRRTRRR